MDDERIVELFFERSEQAIGELSRKYGGLFRRIALNALGDSRDAEECVNDALMAVWNAIPPAKPSPLLPYALRIVRNKAVSRYLSKGNKHARSGYEVCLDELNGLCAASGDPEEALEEKELSDLVNEFLAGEEETNRMLFVRRFFFMDPCAVIARESGMSAGNVRTRLTRIRSRLKAFLKERDVKI